MGKGDRKTRRGKIFRGSYGKTRPHGRKSTSEAPAKGKSTKKAATKRKPAARSKAKK